MTPQDVIAGLPEHERDGALDAAIGHCEAVMAHDLARRMGRWNAPQLAREAAARGARAVITADPDMPHGVRVAFEPIDVPEWARGGESS